MSDPMKTLNPALAKVLKRLHYPLEVILICVRTVVHACSRFDENVLDMSELGDVSLRRRVAAQLIGNDLARHRI